MKQLLLAAAVLAATSAAANAQRSADKVDVQPAAGELSPAARTKAPAVTAPGTHASPGQDVPARAARARPGAAGGPTPDPSPMPPEDPPASDTPSPLVASAAGGPRDAHPARGHLRRGAAFRQSLLFLAVQHGYALTQPKTRRDLGGNFFGDYARSVRSLHGWGDGGRFFTNYVAHPMQGSLLGFVEVQNDPRGSQLRFGRSRDYWRSRARALAWSAAWSTQFEIGPLSQASIGNVGLHGKQTYVDLVITPTAGVGLLVAEDALDKYVIERIERRVRNAWVRRLSRTALNPTRAAANLLRLKKPWHRDAGLR